MVATEPVGANVTFGAAAQYHGLPMPRARARCAAFRRISPDSGVVCEAGGHACGCECGCVRVRVRVRVRESVNVHVRVCVRV